MNPDKRSEASRGFLGTSGTTSSASNASSRGDSGSFTSKSVGAGSNDPKPSFFGSSKSPNPSSSSILG